MARKKARRPGGAAGIEVIDGIDDAADDAQHVTNGSRPDSEPTATRPGRKPKAKFVHQSSDNIGVGDIKKAAAFANSVGGLDKAVALLQILKVAKDVQ
ncbi:MAG: hypothetical protein WD845_07375 [Pirellulales bacterium]